MIKDVPIKKMKLKDLVTCPDNPKVRLESGDIEYERILHSMSDYGNAGVFVVNENPAYPYILDGNQRWQVLMDEGHGDDEYDCKLVNLAVEKAKAFMLRFDHAVGKWDLQKQLDMIKELQNEFDYDVTKDLDYLIDEVTRLEKSLVGAIVNEGESPSSDPDDSETLTVEYKISVPISDSVSFESQLNEVILRFPEIKVSKAGK